MQIVSGIRVVVRSVFAGILFGILLAAGLVAADVPKPKRILLLQQGPDGHAWSSHEYHDGVRIVAEILQKAPGLQVIVVNADEPWSAGPELLDGADGTFLFLAEGANWIGRTPARLEAFKKLAARRGGLVALHWAIGTRQPEPIENFVKLFGGCHGGPDRKHKIVAAVVKPRGAHPILCGIEPFEVEDEFYYRLKFPHIEPKVTPLLDVEIDGESHTVAWAWERNDGGRSAGFSGGHFHKTWRLPQYRRLVVQSILWSVGIEIPKDGMPVDISEKSLELKRPKPSQK